MSEPSERADVVIVGGGIVGLATAASLVRRDPARRVVVVEREAAVGSHQSSRNSGVLHAGVYYAAGSLKARLCHDGKLAMERYCAERGIPVVRNGKVVVAVERTELAALDVLFDRARANEVQGARLLDRDELAEVEPHVAGLRALYSPGTAVVDFQAVCGALASDLPDVRLGVDVRSVVDRAGEVRVETSQGDLRARAAIVCAGLWSEEMARASGLHPNVRIVPFRGAWLPLRAHAAEWVRGNIYPVPDPSLPFLGVHLTRRVDGSVWAGPNAVVSLSHRRVLVRALAFGGTWRLFARYARVGLREVWRDRVRSAYVRELARYLPGLHVDDIDSGPRPYGVRAQAVSSDGDLVDDFVLEVRGRVAHVLNAPSPAATAAFAIGNHLVDLVASQL